MPTRESSRVHAVKMNVIDDVPVMTPTERRLYRLLTAAAIFATALFGVAWFELLRGRDHVVLGTIVTLFIVAHVGLWAARWASLPRMRRPAPLAPADGLRVAVVTTFVPKFEPLEMLEFTLRALVDMSYPHDTWVLDEGDVAEVRALCERYGAHHFTRKHLPQYLSSDGHFREDSKHGNYNAWLEEHGYANYDVLVNFDTDHVPERTYLTETLGYFQEPRVAFVQSAQAYYNQDVSFIARGAAEETFAYYSSHLMASYALGHPVVVGSHCAHRVEALREIGGFPAHDAEDLYQTMLYRAKKWRGVNVPRILALGTTPVDWPGYLKQQLRWSRSVMDLKFHALPSISKQLPTRERLLNLFHGAHYLRPLLYPMLLALLAYLLVTNQVPAFLDPRALLAMAALAGVIMIVDRFRQRYFLDPERESGVHWRAQLLQVAKWPIFGLAVADLIVGYRRPYQTTSKDGRIARRWVLAPGQILTAAGIAVAWAYGEWRNGPVAPTLEIIATVVIIFCALLAWTETWARSTAFAPELRRRATGTQ